MTPLARRLADRIAATGPITVADFMAECLLHPDHGYYATREPFGTAGDFTTAPEISQMFGEMLGLALAQYWLDLGRPAPMLLAELGPGRGTLMADVLRAVGRVPGFAPQIWLVEASPRLREIQRATLSGTGVRFADRIEDLPEAPLFLLANEFFDALPIRQFQRTPEGWRERQVALVDGALAFGLSAPVIRPDLARRDDVPEGGLVEICAPAQAVAGEIGRRLAAQGGAALVFDYGDWRSRGDTLQALRQHAYDPPLAHPGEADLTAHVDFEALALAAAPATASAMLPQGVVLERLGITARAQALARQLDGADLEAHVAAHRRLTHPDEMGTLFKSLALHAPGTPPPPGYA